MLRNDILLFIYKMLFNSFSFFAVGGLKEKRDLGDLSKISKYFMDIFNTHLGKMIIQKNSTLILPLLNYTKFKYIIIILLYILIIFLSFIIKRITF